MSGSITHIRPMRSAYARAAKAVLIVPYGALATIGLVQVIFSEFHLGFTALGALGFLALWVLVWQKSGKMLLAAISIVLWFVALPLLLTWLSHWMPVWTSYLAGGALMSLVTFLGVGLMIEWTRQYYLTRAGGGCQTIEWEWVYVGRDAARTHRLGRLAPGVVCVAAFLLLCGGGRFFYFLEQIHSPYLWAVMVAEALLLILMLRLILTRHPAAYPLVFFLLGWNFPLSIPFLFYWADGVRPNLIYRRRFERLVQPDENYGELYVH